MKSNNTSANEKPARNDAKNTNSVFTALKVLKCLKENSKEDQFISLEELTYRINNHTKQSWETVVDHRTRYDKRNAVKKALLNIQLALGSESPICIVRKHISAEDLEPSDSLYYKQQFDQEEINLLLASLIQCSSLEVKAISPLISKLLHVVNIDNSSLDRKLDDLYLRHSNYIDSKRKPENNLITNLETLIYIMTVADQNDFKKIDFEYCHLDQLGKRVPYDRKYTLSPHYLTLENGHFWLLGLHDQAPNKYYRYAVDRMINIHVIQDEKALPRISSTDPKIKQYLHTHVGSSYDDPQDIIIQLLNKTTAYDAIYDKFGNDFLFLHPDSEGNERIKVHRSPYGVIQWALTYPDRVKIETPEVVEMLRKHALEKLNKHYMNDYRIKEA